MARPPKVVGLRTTTIGEAAEAETPVLPDAKTGIYQFRSRAAAYRFSVRRRRIDRGPDGEKMEVAPHTSDGHDIPMDLVKFEDNNFQTPSKELADAIVEKAKKGNIYGVGLEIWSLQDEKAAIDFALEKELRDRLAARPDIAARVLKPSDAPDFELPAPPA